MNWRLDMRGNFGGLVRLFAFLGLIVLCTTNATAQSPRASSPAAREPFSEYHKALVAAADGALTGLVPLPDDSQVKSPVTEVPERYKLSEEEQIRAFAMKYWNGRVQDLQAAVLRVHRLGPTFDPILLAEGVPTHLAAVVLVESAGRPMALSPRRARGLWQFIPATARRYGLAVGPDRDDRINPERATRAAARYLRDLYEHFGDWPLALAAYNAGEQAVEKAILEAGVADYWVLSSRRLLPLETRNYVPAVLAAMELLGAERTGPARRAGAALRVLPAIYAQTSTSE